MAEREREKNGEKGDKCWERKRMRGWDRDRGNERGEDKIVSEGGQAKTFPVCTGHTVLREELVCVRWGDVREVLEVLGDVIAPLSPSLAQDYVT